MVCIAFKSPAHETLLTLPIVADKFPSAKVIGTDLSAIQPQWMPVNARMFVEDCEEQDWLHGAEFDFVHYRSIANLVKDFDGMLSRAYS